MNALAPADLRWLEAAARIAMPYRGTTAENPTVGAIIVSTDGIVLGRGVTAPGGRPHAEPLALAQAAERAKGATLYVTLEPCNHWGQTPPCVDAIITSGMGRVVCGSVDPDVRTGGRSVDRLRSAGVAVSVGQGVSIVERLHEGFFSRMRRGRPYISAKLAVSRDGKIGRTDAGNVPITGDDARRWTHMQRAFSDAVMVGGRTALIDRPRLNVRLDGLRDRRPRRVFLAGSTTLPALARSEIEMGLQTVIFGENTEVGSLSHTTGLVGVAGGNGSPDIGAALSALAEIGVGRVLVEGGARLNDALLDAGLLDRFHLLEGDVTIGPDGVPATVYQSLPERLDQLGFSVVERRALGCDMLTTFEKA